MQKPKVGFSFSAHTQFPFSSTFFFLEMSCWQFKPANARKKEVREIFMIGKRWRKEEGGQK